MRAMDPDAILKRLSLIAVCLLLAVAVAACGGDDDDDDDDSAGTAATTVATETRASSSAATATEGTDEATATVAADAATATQPGATATEADATATATEEATEESAEATATDDLTGTEEDPFEELEPLDPDALPNFTLTSDIRFVNYDGTPESNISVLIEQSAVDSYHISTASDEFVAEQWRIGDRAWTSTDGEIIEIPVEGTFGTDIFLTQLPEFPEELEVEREGEEEVSGRETTRYVISGEDYVEYLNETGDLTVGISNGGGEFTIWVDNELNVMIKADGEITFDNDDGTEGSFSYQYLIDDIDSTSQVEPPQ